MLIGFLFNSLLNLKFIKFECELKYLFSNSVLLLTVVSMILTNFSSIPIIAKKLLIYYNLSHYIFY